MLENWSEDSHACKIKGYPVLLDLLQEHLQLIGSI